MPTTTKAEIDPSEEEAELVDPERSCAACRRRASADDLVRFMVGPDGQVVMDPKRRLGGRGASLCWSRECLAKSERVLARAFKIAPEMCKTQAVLEQVHGHLLRRVRDDLGLCRKVGQLQSGADACEQSGRKGWAQAYLLTNNAGGALIRRFEHSAKELALPLFVLRLDSDEVGQCLGTAPRSVCAVGRGRLADGLLGTLRRVEETL